MDFIGISGPILDLGHSSTTGAIAIAFRGTSPGDRGHGNDLLP